MTPDGHRGLSLGAAAWFVKPVVRDDLLRAARRAVPRDDGRQPAAIVAGSDPAALQLQGLYLEQNGFAVTRVETGRELVELAREQRPDLLVMDLLLPDRNGFDIIGALRASPDTRDIPVIICTEPEIPQRLHEQLRRSIEAQLNGDGLREQLLREIQRLSEMEQAARW
jgi:CheY-like chemotaxis protein